MRSQRRKQAEQPPVSQTTVPKKQRVASKVGKVALACLSREASLLRCSLVHAEGSRQRAALWISLNQWKLIILRVVMAIFVGSTQLEKLRRNGTDNEEILSTESQLGDSWLQHPELVKPTSESNRVKYLNSGCVKPAAWSKINHKKAADGQPGPSTRSNSTPLVRKWASTEGYVYVEFKVMGVLALIEDEFDEKELASRTKGLGKPRAEELKASLRREGKWSKVNESYIFWVSLVEVTRTNKVLWCARFFLRNQVLCCAVLCCAVLCCAVPCCAGPG